MSTEMLQRGIQAYEAGETEQARRLLTRVVKEDKTDEQAWYYLSKVMDNPDRKRQCLQMALRLNPDNTAARRDLAALDLEDETEQFEQDLNQAPPTARPRPDDQIESVRTSTTQTPSEGQLGIKWLAAIPGAPGRINSAYIGGFMREMFQDGLAALQGKDSIYEATWWRFWMTAWATSFICGILYVVEELIFDIRFEIAPTFIALFTIPIIVVIMGIIAFGVAGFASHWYVTRQSGGSADLLEHSYSTARILAIPAITLSVLAAAQAAFAGARVLTLANFLVTGSLSLNTAGIILTVLAIAVTGFTIFRLQATITQKHGVPAAAGWIGALIIAVVIAFVFP